MPGLVRTGLLVLGAALAAGCSTTDVWPLARNQAVAWNVDPAIPAAVRAPKGHVLLGHVVGRGVATFTLQADRHDPDRYAWVVSNDEGGDLLDENGHVIGHRAGHSWSGNNGSRVSAEPVARVWQRGRVPLELFEATGHQGRGTLARAEFIEQLHTVGGPPKALLQRAQPGASVRAEYSADYYFYGPVAAQTKGDRGASY